MNAVFCQLKNLSREVDGFFIWQKITCIPHFDVIHEEQQADSHLKTEVEVLFALEARRASKVEED